MPYPITEQERWLALVELERETAELEDMIPGRQRPASISAAALARKLYPDDPGLEEQALREEIDRRPSVAEYNRRIDAVERRLAAAQREYAAARIAHVRAARQRHRPQPPRTRSRTKVRLASSRPSRLATASDSSTPAAPDDGGGGDDPDADGHRLDAIGALAAAATSVPLEVRA